MEHEGEDEIREDVIEVLTIEEGISILRGQTSNSFVLNHDGNRPEK